MGYETNQLHVPNNSDDADLMQKEAESKNICILKTMSLSDYLKIASEEKKKFVGVWADYCGIFKKNSQDFSDIFSFGLLESRAILCATFSTRGDEPREKIKAKIEKSARDNGYVATELETKVYMRKFFIIFAIEKVDIDQ